MGQQTNLRIGENMDKTGFYAYLRKRESGVFGTSLSQRQVDGIEGIIRAFEQCGDGEGSTLAYALATAYHETGGRMVPVREGFAKTDAGARRAVRALARKRGPNSAVAKYSKPSGPYGHVYYGRGHVQLTWERNYATSSADAGVDLVQYPDKMLDPEISARVLIRGLLDGRWNKRGHGLRYYLDENDMKGARRTVNRIDRWSDIASYFLAFQDAIIFGGGGWKKPLPEPIPFEAFLDKYREEPSGGLLSFLRGLFSWGK